LCDHKGIECQFYSLDSEKDWEADLHHLRSLINDRTRAILVNNPSNPCGSVYTREHLLDIIAIAEEYCVPIIADEIYGQMTFEGKFYPVAALTNTVPVLAVGGIAKQYLVPGWRLGWISIYDSANIFHEVRQGLQRLSTLILGPNTIVQGAVVQIFNETPDDFYTTLNNTLKEHADYTVERISKIPGLKVIKPRGAMYCMVEIDIEKFKSEEIYDDVTFSKILLREESVFVLPGQCFRMHNFFRIVICPPVPKLKDAYDRLEQFCHRKLQQ
jgi:tyrosine aminotransferase